MKIFIWVILAVLVLGILGNLYKMIQGDFTKTRREVAFDIVFGVGLLVYGAIILTTN